MLEFEFINLTAYLLVFARMSGMLLMNPLISRRNVPPQIRMALILMLTLLIAPTLTADHLASYKELDLVVGILMEAFIGFVCGYVFQVFYYMLFFAGDILDFQFGLSMAKVFDPGTNIQMSVTGSLLNILFVLYIFATDSHLLMIRIMASSFDVIAVGAQALNPDIAGFCMNLFIAAFSLAIRLALPYIAAEFVLEVSMGVLMKLIPQIHVFVINIQFKLLLAIILLFAFAAPLSGFTDNYMNIMFQNMQKALYTLAG